MTGVRPCFDIWIFVVVKFNDGLVFSFSINRLMKWIDTLF